MKILKFKIFEDGEGGTASATLGNSSGMGDIVAPQPGAIPGTTGTIGSGDLPAYDHGKYFGTKPRKKRKYSSKERMYGTDTPKESMYVTTFSDWCSNENIEINEKSTSKSQQRLFGMAYAVRTGKMKKSDVNKSVLDIVESDMTDKEIEDFAKTKHEDLPQKANESVDDSYFEMKNFIERIANTGLIPTSIEFWRIVEEAKEILRNSY